jgi:hypothetical protein
MKSVQAICRFVSNAWLVAAPLVIVFLLIAVLILAAIVSVIVERMFGSEAAEGFSAFWLNVTMWAGELLLVLAPIGLAIYALVRLARWLLRKKES